MSVKFAQRLGSTRVPRVQFGVPPNCSETRHLAFTCSRYSMRRLSPVSGGTPETTRETRVLQQSNESARHT